jgi:hypothetical protein
MPDEKFTPQISALYDKERGVKRRLLGYDMGKQQGVTMLENSTARLRVMSERTPETSTGVAGFIQCMMRS